MSNTDWTGNSRSAHAILGARNYAREDRQVDDYYATEPKAAILLMEVEQFSPMIWECACGEGHLSEEFRKAGYQVYSSDLVNRGYGNEQDFLQSIAPPPITRIRYHHKPALQIRYGVCGSRYGDHRSRSQSGDVLKTAIPRGKAA